jgi:hypothetical protein
MTTKVFTPLRRGFFCLVQTRSMGQRHCLLALSGRRPYNIKFREKAMPSDLLELLEAVARGGFHACAKTESDKDMLAIAAVDKLVAAAEDRGYVVPAKRLMSSSRTHQSMTKALIVPSLTSLGRVYIEEARNAVPDSRA